MVARKQINALKDPATKVVGMVTEELQKTVRDGLDKVRGTLIPEKPRERGKKASSSSVVRTKEGEGKQMSCDHTTLIFAWHVSCYFLSCVPSFLE